MADDSRVIEDESFPNPQQRSSNLLERGLSAGPFADMPPSFGTIIFNSYRGGLRPGSRTLLPSQDEGDRLLGSHKSHGGRSEKQAEVDVMIPSWSLEDRVGRAKVKHHWTLHWLGSNVLISFAFVVFFLLNELRFDPSGRQGNSTFVICMFIVMQIPVTLIKAIPLEDETNDEINKRVNASILVAMTLYPCLGLWIMDRDKSVNLRNFWRVLDIDNFFEMCEKERYQWGYIFPFFFWATSACILLRECNFAHTVDRMGIVSGPKGEAVTALFRRDPPFLERWTHRITRWMTSSLWTVLPMRYRPAGKAGRFLFQAISPVVIMFLYVGWRLIMFSISTFHYTVNHRSDYTSAKTLVEKYGEQFVENAKARLIVWGVFTIYCVIIRSVIGRQEFLSAVMKDPQSLKKRWQGWSEAIIMSKRTRVLWAFRGLANAAVPYYEIRNESNSNLSGFIDGVMRYLYSGVYVSFLMEGIGAIWFGLNEAQRGCNLQTPFSLFTELSFWGAFNVILQPFGTAVNCLFFFINKEYQMKIVLREIWGPLLLNERNHFRKNILTRWLRKAPRVPTQAELDERLDEWISTFVRKRRDVGKDAENYMVICLHDGEFPTFSGPQVFHGTMFPTRDEWLYMRDHYEDFISLQPWERVYGPEKFLCWYPTYREEVLSLLREPCDFDVRREVWMFGYGSLMSPDCPPSGLSEAQRKQIVPYWLKRQAGYCRTWNFRHGAAGINAFGLEKVKEDQEGMDICGCIYPMNYEKASDLFCLREDGYELLFVHEDYFEPMHEEFVLPKGVGYLWVCGQPTLRCERETDCTLIECKRHYPTYDSPILQTYIDAVVEGALRYSTAGLGHVDGMNFAAALLKSTSGWNFPWYNDRQVPGRPWSLTPKWELIDGLLSTCPTSRDAFINRLRTSLQPQSKERKEMFRRVKDSLVGWAEKFYCTVDALNDDNMHKTLDTTK